MEVILKNLKDTQKLAQKVTKEIVTKGYPSVVALYGDLGAGKTTFVQFLAKALGIKEKILSPTFVIIKIFDLDARIYSDPLRQSSSEASQTRTHADKFKRLVHVDAYRLKSAKDLLALGLRDILRDPENITIIEWPEKIERYLPKNTKRIYFETVGITQRKITIT